MADLLDTTVAYFPGGHGGFLGGEYGQTGEPAAFAERLRDVLANADDEPCDDPRRELHRLHVRVETVAGTGDVRSDLAK